LHAPPYTRHTSKNKPKNKNYQKQQQTTNQQTLFGNKYRGYQTLHTQTLTKQPS